MVNRKNTEIHFSCYVKGDEIKGWPTIKFPEYTWGLVSLNESEITIVSGWTRMARIKIPTKSVTSVLSDKYHRLSFELDTYTISYKKDSQVKKTELLMMYYTPMVLSSKVKEYFNKLR